MPAVTPDVKELFLAAADKATPEERAAFLDGACAGDALLRRRVEALLKAHDESGGFLEGPGLGAATGDEPGASPATAALPGEQPSERVGPYKWLQKLGEGGMGAVGSAEQEQPGR